MTGIRSSRAKPPTIAKSSLYMRFTVQFMPSVKIMET